MDGGGFDPGGNGGGSFSRGSGSGGFGPGGFGGPGSGGDSGSDGSGMVSGGGRDLDVHPGGGPTGAPTLPGGGHGREIDIPTVEAEDRDDEKYFRDELQSQDVAISNIEIALGVDLPVQSAAGTADDILIAKYLAAMLQSDLWVDALRKAVAAHGGPGIDVDVLRLRRILTNYVIDGQLQHG